MRPSLASIRYAGRRRPARPPGAAERRTHDPDHGDDFDAHAYYHLPHPRRRPDRSRCGRLRGRQRSRRSRRARCGIAGKGWPEHSPSQRAHLLQQQLHRQHGGVLDEPGRQRPPAAHVLRRPRRVARRLARREEAGYRGPGRRLRGRSGLYDECGRHKPATCDEPDRRSSWVPAWSPDGRRIAYAFIDANNLSESAIWTVAASGGKETRLTPLGQNASSASWSPDGARIVYAASPPALGNADLYVMNADGSAPQLLYDCVEWCMNPVWSHDGTRIFYVAAGSFTKQIEYCVLQPQGAVCGIPLATGVSTF